MNVSVVSFHSERLICRFLDGKFEGWSEQMLNHWLPMCFLGKRMESRSSSHRKLIFCFLSKKKFVLRTMEFLNTKTSINPCMEETIPYESQKKKKRQPTSKDYISRKADWGKINTSYFRACGSHRL